MSLSRPSPPAPPPTVQQYEKTVEQRAAEIEKEEASIGEAAAEKQKVEERKKTGRRKTILTSPFGVQATAPTDKKRLFGE